MTPGESEFVEEMGQFLGTLGMTPMAGRMWGYLLICDPAEQTAAQIADALKASRGSVSGTARLLAGPRPGISDSDLPVNEGEAFGFLGPNGAGKTTTIRTLLDHLRPTIGRATIFGIDTTVDPVAIHRRIGYLPGEFALYDKLTGGQTIDYFANLRGGVDAAYQADLIRPLDLDTSRKFKEDSKGNKQKVGLILAPQHRPH